jgi:heptosyltransferase-2
MMTHPPADFSGKLSLLETAALLDRADLLVTNDTGVMHMAAALKTPVVALFGPTSGQLGFTPFRAPSIVIEKDLGCRPCSYHGSRRCPKSHFNCMRFIESEEVIDSAETLIQKGGSG